MGKLTAREYIALRTAQGVVLSRQWHATLLWREYGYGRLYWRNAHPGWNWENGEIARAINHPIVTHFYTIEAILESLRDN